MRTCIAQNASYCHTLHVVFAQANFHSARRVTQ